MSTTSRLSTALREWTGLFMRRSMRDSFHFVKEAGLSITQFNTLMRLYHGGTCGVSNIGDYLGITNAATSQMAQRLVEQGLLQRTEDPTDRRVKQLALTAEGHNLIEQAIAARCHWLEDLITVLSQEQQVNIAAAFDDLIAAARKLDSTFK